MHPSVRALNLSRAYLLDVLWGPRVLHTVFVLLWPWPCPLASILEKSCPDHISYIIWGRNPKFGVLIHFGVSECRLLFFWSLWLWTLVSVLEKCVGNISPILFEVRIPNLVCGYILGLGSFTQCFRITLTFGFSSWNIWFWGHLSQCDKLPWSFLYSL